MNSNENILVSVIMAAYNAENYIAETIESILAQTHKNFELIIVNDCSTDNTLSIISEYAKKDNRIKLINNEVNLKLPTSLNKGIDIAKGKYIARIDADDLAISYRIEKQLFFMENNNEYGFCGSLVKCFYAEDNISKPYSSIEEMEKQHFNYISKSADYEKTYKKIKKGNFTTTRICHSSLFGKTSLFKLLKYNEKVFAEDWELYHRALSRGIKITKLPIVLVKYRINNLGMCGNFNMLSYEAAVKKTRMLYNEIIKDKIKKHKYFYLCKFIHSIDYFHYKKAFKSIEKFIFNYSNKKGCKKIKILGMSIFKKVKRNNHKKLYLFGMRVFSKKCLTKDVMLSDYDKYCNCDINGKDIRYNIGVWTIEKKWAMGGLYTILKMVTEIIKRGHKIRIINYGLHNDDLIADFKLYMQEYYSLSLDEVEQIDVVYFIAFRNKYLQCNCNDKFIAGYWCPAEDIQKIHSESNYFINKKYAYIIQDYEPSMLYRWGSEYIRSYNTFLDKNYYPIFNNSEFVCGYMKKLGLIDSWLPVQMLHGEPCETKPAEKNKMIADSKSIKLVFYSRPSVDKNIYELKIQALKMFIDRLTDENPQALEGIEITGIGEDCEDIEYKGIKIRNLGKLDYKNYPDFLQDYNVGLSCIVSPAFAYPCVEFPRAGIVTVVNRFETRDLECFSKNIISCDNNVVSICDKLIEASKKIKDVETRIKSSSFTLPGVGIGEATEEMLKKI